MLLFEKKLKDFRKAFTFVAPQIAIHTKLLWDVSLFICYTLHFDAAGRKTKKTKIYSAAGSRTREIQLIC